MNEQYQDYDQQMPQQNYGYVPQMNPNDRADLLDKIKPDIIVEILKHQLLGEELIDGKWVLNPAFKNLALTKIGAWDIANLLVGVSSQNTSISYLNDVEIKNRAKNITKTALRKCIKNYKAYGIQGTDQFYFVKEIVYSIALVTLKQSDEGHIADLIKNTRRDQFSNQQQKEGGWLSGIFRK